MRGGREMLLVGNHEIKLGNYQCKFCYLADITILTMFAIKQLFLWAIVSFFVLVKTEKILVIFQAPAFSHYQLGNKLVHLLADRGHEVTFISPFKDKNNPKSCREVYLSGFYEEAEKMKDKMFSEKPSFFKFFSLMAAMGPNVTELVLSHPNVKQLLSDPKETFDLIIMEEFMNQGFKALAHKYKAPIVAVSPAGAVSWINSIFKNPAPISYNPNVFLGFSSHMTFIQRLINAAATAINVLLEDFIITPKMNKLIDKHFPGSPHIDELNNEVALILLNSHVSTNQPVSLLPNMIEIGGFHVNPPKKLPSDLEKYLNESKNGAILFSLGSNMKSKYLSEDIRDTIMKSFAKLKQNVLWKFEDENLPGKPDNVKISKWLPQQDILAHPNVKLFITHGGLLSTIETIHRGVPIIALPIGADQKLNAANAVVEGFAVASLDPFTLNEEEFTAALNEALNNPKYTENVKKRSEIMLDRIVSPAETAVYWIEYVLRHNGSKHFRSAAMDLTWYQLYSLDIIGFVIFVIWGVFFAFKALCRSYCCKKSGLQKKNKND